MVRPVARTVAAPVLLAVEGAYRRAHRLERISRLILVEPGTHGGPPRTLGDGTRLRPGDPVAVLHFDNRALARLRRGRGRRKGALVFARLLLEGLEELAAQAPIHPSLQEARAFHGITWIPPHGRKLGLEADPLPDTWGNRLRSLHFRLLVRVFAPGSADGAGGDGDDDASPFWPHAYWLSREDLLEKFGPGARPDVPRRLREAGRQEGDR